MRSGGFVIVVVRVRFVPLTVGVAMMIAVALRDRHRVALLVGRSLLRRAFLVMRTTSVSTAAAAVGVVPAAVRFAGDAVVVIIIIVVGIVVVTFLVVLCRMVRRFSGHNMGGGHSWHCMRLLSFNAVKYVVSNK
jgi:hypothetical protein